MSTLYITEANTVVRLSSRTLQITKDRENGVFLDDDGRRTFFRYYDERLKRGVRGHNPKLNPRDIMKRQVRAMAATIKRYAPYKPFQYRA